MAKQAISVSTIPHHSPIFSRRYLKTLNLHRLEIYCPMSTLAWLRSPQTSWVQSSAQRSVNRVNHLHTLACMRLFQLDRVARRAFRRPSSRLSGGRQPVFFALEVSTS